MDILLKQHYDKNQQYMWNLISCNKIVDQKLRQKEAQRQEKKMKTICAILKVQEPYKPLFLKTKQKQWLKKAQTLYEINRNNMLLVEKMKETDRKCENYWRKTQRSVSAIGRSTRMLHTRNQNKKIEIENEQIIKKLIAVSSGYRGIISLSGSQQLRTRPLSGQVSCKNRPNRMIFEDDFTRYNDNESSLQKKNRKRCKSAVKRSKTQHSTAVQMFYE